MNKSKVISKAALSCLELGDLMPMAAMTSLRMVCLSNALFALICLYKNLGYVFFKPNRKYCEDHKDCESELRQILGPQAGSTLSGSPI